MELQALQLPLFTGDVDRYIRELERALKNYDEQLREILRRQRDASHSIAVGRMFECGL